MSLITPDPDWLRILASDAEDDAFDELQERLDRQAEHAPPPAWTTRSAPTGQGRGAQPKETQTP